MAKIEKKTPKVSVSYQLFKKYVRFCQNHLLFEHVYYFNREVLPEKGIPTVIISNHQSCAIDPLAMLLCLENDTHPFVIARGDSFDINPAINKFFDWLGMIPAFRMEYEGVEAAVANSARTLGIASDKLVEGHRIIMYPESIHQQGRYLAEFKVGYLRLLFQTAERENFENDAYVMPLAHHYSSYFGAFQDFMIMFGTPISLKPYYERFKTKPRTVQREINKLVREQVESMMLDVHDKEHYDTIDFLRNTYAKRNVILPEQLKLDKAFCAKLEAAQAENPEVVADIYADADLLREGIAKLKIGDHCFAKKTNRAVALLSLLAQIVLLPLWIFSLCPSILFYKVPQLFLKTDPMFTNSLIFIMTVVVLLPVCALIALLTLGLTLGWMGLAIACVWVALWFPLSKFAWYQTLWMERTREDLRFFARKNKSKVAELRAIRERLYAKLDKISK